MEPMSPICGDDLRIHHNGAERSRDQKREARLETSKLAAAKGLCRSVNSSGGKLWRLKYRANRADGQGEPKRIESCFRWVAA
jgi:hypothetical protein